MNQRLRRAMEQTFAAAEAEQEAAIECSTADLLADARTAWQAAEPVLSKARLLESSVHAIADLLVDRGLAPTYEHIKAVHGSGSPNLIHSAVKTFFAHWAERAKAPPSAVPAVLIEAWDQALALGRREAKERMAADRQALVADRDTFVAEAQALRESRDLATQALATAEARRQDAERRLAQLEKDLTSVRKQHASDSAALVELRTQRKAEQQTLAAAQAEARRHANDVGARQRELDEARGARDSVASRLNVTEKALTQAQAALHTAQQDVAAADAARDASVATSHQWRDQNATLTERVAHAESSSAAAEAARAQLATTVERLTRELTDGQSRLDAATTDLATAKKAGERLAVMEENFAALLTEIRRYRSYRMPSRTTIGSAMTLSKDDALQADEDDIAEQRLDHLAEQAAILVVVDDTSRKIAIKRVLDAQHHQDTASADQVETDEEGNVVGYLDTAAQDRPLPSNATQRRKIAKLAQELRDELERS